MAANASAPPRRRSCRGTSTKRSSHRTGGGTTAALSSAAARRSRSSSSLSMTSIISSGCYCLLPMILSAVLLLPKASATNESNNIPFGYQSSQSSSLMTGSTYAASAAYDPVTSILYVVGASYESSLAFTEARAEVEEELETVRDGGGQSGDDEEEGSSAAAAAAAVSETQQQQQPQQPRPSDCYLTALALPSNPTGASGILTKSLGESGVAEACTAVTLLSSSFSGTSEPSSASASTSSGEDGNNNDNNNDNVETSHLVVLGHTAPDGLLTDLRSVGSDKSTTYGYALDLTISATLPDGGIKIDDVTGEVTQRTSIEFGTKLLGGRLFHEDVVSYPLAATIPPARLMGGGEDEEEEGDEMIPNGAGPEFVYVLLQTSDVDPTNVGVANNFGFGSPPADDEDQGEDGQDGSAAQGGDNRSSGSSSSSPSSSSEEEEQDPTVPTNGGTSLTVKKVALTSTTPSRVKYDSNAADDNNDSASTGQTNSMVGQTMIDQWTQQYAPLDGTSVSASDLLYVPRTITTKTETQTKVTKADVLLLAGSTRGFGPSFGQSNADGTYDTDGFVTLLDPDTGLVVDLNANNANGRNSAVNPLFSSSQGDKKSSLRIRSTFDGHDVIHGLCIDTKTDNVDSVYIVGSTTGTLTRPRSKATTAVDGSLEIETPSRDEMLGSTPRRRAFVMKLNLEDGLSTEWVREYRSEFGRKSSSSGGGDGTDAYATGCAVSSDDGAVYVGGVVTDGGRITGDGVGRHRHFSSGGDDVFIVRIASDSGSAEWARQIGSRGDDRLASRGGVILDNDGGAILVGTTSGSLMRSRDGDADTSSMDAFVMSVSKLGEAVTPVDPAVRGYASMDGECYFVSDPILYLVIVSAVSALCAFLLGHALRQRQALSKIIHRYSTQGREIKGVVVKLNKSRCLDVASRFVLVQYLIPSSSGGRLNKRIDNLSKRTHRNLSVGCLVNLHVIPGHDKSGVALHELKISLRRLWREVIVICFLLLASFAMSLLFATCLPWYGWVIAIVPPIVTASLAWLLWRNAHPNMELVFVHGEGCVPAGRAEESAVDECEWTDNDQTDDDTSSPHTGIDTFNSDVV